MSDLDQKYIAIIIDDFSSRSYNLDNVEIYDYGSSFITTFQDTYYMNVDEDSPSYLNKLGYGDVDDTIATHIDSHFVHVDVIDEIRHLDNTETSLGFVFGPSSAYFGWAEFFKTESFISFSPESSSSSSLPNHGDWVLDAFLTSLDNPEDVYTIGIDIDFTGGGDFNHLFSSSASSPFNGEEVSYLTYLYETAFANHIYEEGNYYIILGFNASFGGNSVQLESDTITEFLSDDMVIVQAAPNTSQSGINWGNVFPNVINVGAWNVDNSGYYLAGNYEQLYSVDISADGYVTKAGWGDNFGTSFAAPRVFAEIFNLADKAIADTISSDELPQDTDLTEPEYTNLVNKFIEKISVEYEIQFEGLDEFFGPINVLDDGTNENGIYPIAIPYSKDQFNPPPGDYELVVISDTRMVNSSDDPPPPNNDPYFNGIVNSGDYPSFQENTPGGSVIAVYSASDSDGDNLTFSITGGADQSYFEIETIQSENGYIGRVKVKEYGQPDFDTLKDTYG